MKSTFARRDLRKVPRDRGLPPRRGKFDALFDFRGTPDITGGGDRCDAPLGRAIINHACNINIYIDSGTNSAAYLSGTRYTAACGLILKSSVSISSFSHMLY